MSALRHIPAVPEGFAARFIAGGWREVERIYGARTALLLKWIEMSGGEDLHRRRREHLRQYGMKPSIACPGGRGPRPQGVTIKGWLE